MRTCIEEAQRLCSVERLTFNDHPVSLLDILRLRMEEAVIYRDRS